MNTGTDYYFIFLKEFYKFLMHDASPTFLQMIRDTNTEEALKTVEDYEEFLRLVKAHTLETLYYFDAGAAAQYVVGKYNVHAHDLSMFKDITRASNRFLEFIFEEDKNGL